MKCTRMIHTTLAIMELFFLQKSIIFNTILPKTSKILYTNVVKFPALTSGHIMSGTKKL
jgi:hypothetical protein